MCGITGYFSYENKVDTKKYYEAHKKIAHRGPDDEGFVYRNEDNILEYLCGDDTIEELKNREHIISKNSSSMIFGHRRLSIIDLSAHGHQPFMYESLSMVYNGEIFNYVELRDELIEEGYTFQTQSDTEVFLMGYHFWGVECFNKFNGMWAAAIYDGKTDEILLTRDRFGIKPLYYSIVDDNLIFGSEIKFVSSFMDDLYPNEQRVYDYLRFNYIDHTNETLFKDILQLEPSYYMVYSKNRTKSSKYWDFKEEENVSKIDIEQKLNDAISLRMRSDVEVGSLLSGGIDSSLILGIINDKKYATKFKTFSAVFKEEKFSEKKYIDKFETDNIELKKHFIYPKPEELIEVIDELIYTQEEPFRGLSVFSQYNIYKYINNNTETKVLLNGQGADEIFTGYTAYFYIYLIELLKGVKIKTFFHEFTSFKNKRNISSISLLKQILSAMLNEKFRKNDKYKIFNKKFYGKEQKEKFSNKLSNSLWNSLTFSALREYLRYEDKNSMRFSLESRLPFLDFRLVQSAFSLQDKYKIKNGVSKVILREIAKGKIPKTTLEEINKMGFIAPQAIWQKTILKNEFDYIFNEIFRDQLFGFLSTEKINCIYKLYQNNEFKDDFLIWRLYLLYKWKKKWKIKDSNV